MKNSNKNTAIPKNKPQKKEDKKTSKRGVKWLSTKIRDDVFTDEVSLFKPHIVADIDAYINNLWDSSPEIHDLLQRSQDLEEARDAFYTHLEKLERNVFALDNDLHILEKSTVRESIRVLRSVIGPINEYRTEYSALESLWKLAQGRREELKEKISAGFLLEFIHLFRAINGKSNVYHEDEQVKKGIPDFLKMEGREAAMKRTEILDDMGTSLKKYFKKYPSGLEEEVINWRRENKSKILRYFKEVADHWQDYKWHLKNVIHDATILADLIELTSEQKKAVENAVQFKIPFGITPYYLSLMDTRMSIGYDHAVRAQVIPPKEYVDKMVEHRQDRNISLDFMGEHDTSPVDLITRRYPVIAIVKPFNTCAQICVYCQRNWEIDRVLDPNALSSKEKISQAVAWLDEHKSVGDVLVTGGDPLVMNDNQLKYLLDALAEKKHIYRIRIGSRIPVVLPMRITDELVSLIAGYHSPPTREIALVTHFEHSYEITPESMEAIQKIRKAGMGVYNQQVYTLENSRRFETVKLRKDLRSIGVDPYYTFNMKGKEETKRLMVPIARILQERKEEARLLPGLDRTDEPVFNVPKLGKNHLRANQDHRLVMILPDGSRVYEFHPWEKNITAVPPYNYVDVPIFDYLGELALRGENVMDYRTIWYYY